MNLQLSNVSHSIVATANVNLVMARADQLHPLASGNKFYKLKHNLTHAKRINIKGLLSFGGAFSNHIHALALTAQNANLESVGIIRGEKNYATNPTLTIARNAGMKLEFLSREAYRQKESPVFLNDLKARYPDYLIIPEGGSNQLGVKGCKALAHEINANNKGPAFDALLVAAGTGATLAGLACGAKAQQNVIGYAVLRDKSMPSRVSDFIKKEQASDSNYQIEQADFGGYAKLDKALLDFIFDWYKQTKILLDPIYTSKLCLRLMQQIEAGVFDESANLCIIHTGGLQGWLGMEKQVVKLAGEDKWRDILAHLGISKK